MVKTPGWPAAILFDFDGVVVDSEPIHFQAFRAVAAEENLDLTEEAYYRDLIGFDDRGGFSFLFQQQHRPLNNADLRRLMTRKATVVQEMLHAGNYQALAGVDWFVKSMARQRPLAICSGALRSEIKCMLRGIRLGEFFELIVSADDVTVGKPDPQGYLMTVDRLNRATGKSLTPADCLIIEDAPNVIRSVKAAGFPVLGVATTYPIAELRDADFAVASLERDEISRVLPELTVVD